MRRKSEGGVPVESFIFPHIWTVRQDSHPAFCSDSDLWVQLWESEWMQWTASEVLSIIIYDGYTVMYDWLTFTDGIIHQTLKCIFRNHLLVWCWFSKAKCNLSLQSKDPISFYYFLKCFFQSIMILPSPTLLQDLLLKIHHFIIETIRTFQKKNIHRFLNQVCTHWKLVNIKFSNCENPRKTSFQRSKHKFWLFIYLFWGTQTPNSSFGMELLLQSHDSWAIFPHWQGLMSGRKLKPVRCSSVIATRI